MKRIILIYPKTGGLFVNLRKKRPLPLGLLSAAVYLTEKYDVKIFDQNLYCDWKLELKKIVNEDTILAGVHTMGGTQILHALEISEYLKSSKNFKLKINIPVIWGGVHPSLIPEVVLKEPSIDYVCVGEAEETLFEFAQAIEKKEDISKVRGIYYKKNKEFIFTGIRDFIDLNELPDLPYHLINVSEYNVSAGSRFEKDKLKLNIETSRGCVQDCIFCYNPVFNKRKWRAQSAEKVLKRIERLVKEYNVSCLDFIDDAFFTDLKRVEDIARGLIKRNIAIKWFLQGVDIDKLISVSDAYLELIEHAGCSILRMGAESGSVKMLEGMQKKSSLLDIIQLNNRLKKTNMICYYYFTIGMPGETRIDLKKSIDLMFKLLEDNPQARILSAFCLTPQPGTKLLEQAQGQGFKMPGSLKEWAKIDGSTIITPWFNAKEKKELNFIFFLSLFIDEKSNDIIESVFVRLLCKVYRPIARYRLKNLNFKFPWEFKIFSLVKNIMF
ncbi:MAG: radical SAM protein [Candidatus Omnitrophota bacterium]